jgi:hypothetical protein
LAVARRRAGAQRAAHCRRRARELHEGTGLEALSLELVPLHESQANSHHVYEVHAYTGKPPVRRRPVAIAGSWRWRWQQRRCPLLIW